MSLLDVTRSKTCSGIRVLRVGDVCCLLRTSPFGAELDMCVPLQSRDCCCAEYLGVAAIVRLLVDVDWKCFCSSLNGLTFYCVFLLFSAFEDSYINNPHKNPKTKLALSKHRLLWVGLGLSLQSLGLGGGNILM